MKKLNMVFFDFDGCFAHSPLPKTGKETWSKYHGIEYPHNGWWGRVESMCPDAFDVKLNDELVDKYNIYKYNNWYTCIHTSRLYKFKPIIADILKKNDIDMDDIYCRSSLDKGQKIVDVIMKKIDAGFTVGDVHFYDDRDKEITAVSNQRKKIERLIDGDLTITQADNNERNL